MITPVRKLLCLMLLLWFGFVAGLAQAHAVVEELHQLEHIGQSLNSPSSAETDHEEHCGLSKCGQVLCMGITADEASAPPERSALAAPFPHLLSSLVLDDIERPKWASATIAVASL